MITKATTRRIARKYCSSNKRCCLSGRSMSLQNQIFSASTPCSFWKVRNMVILIIKGHVLILKRNKREIANCADKTDVSLQVLKWPNLNCDSMEWTQRYFETSLLDVVLTHRIEYWSNIRNFVSVFSVIQGKQLKAQDGLYFCCLLKRCPHNNKNQHASIHRIICSRYAHCCRIRYFPKAWGLPQRDPTRFNHPRTRSLSQT